MSAETFAASCSEKSFVQNAYLIDQYKKLEARLSAADEMVDHLCEVLMQGKGRLFKKILDTNNSPEKAG